MQIGDKIKTIYGNVETVMNLEEARITTFESFCKNSWYHPTKVFPVNWSETIEKLCQCAGGLRWNPSSAEKTFHSSTGTASPQDNRPYTQLEINTC
ncbi:MAG: hypothetical protein BMS9Abin03_453 [Thermodesulfobacteriota bacterium]|nr:MAG: hypothetical protein BMS9Abin03_453 [Thermodesulfobacteriota bacterium]